MAMVTPQELSARRPAVRLAKDPILPSVALCLSQAPFFKGEKLKSKEGNLLQLTSSLGPQGLLFAIWSEKR